MSKLQSSINVVGGLGVWSNAMVYASLILSCMFLPSIMIDKLTVKWALVVSVFCYSSYIAAQFYPEFYTLLPTAFVLGLGAAPMWSAKCTYLTQVAHRWENNLDNHRQRLSDVNLMKQIPGLPSWRARTPRR